MAIAIKKSNAGKLRKTAKARKGKKIPVATLQKMKTCDRVPPQS
jgi:hypothetical protein